MLVIARQNQSIVRVYNPRNRAWARFRRNKLALVGGVLETLLIICAIFAPLIAPHDPYKVNLTNNLAPPSSENLLGTDAVGRDVLSRTIYGARISLTVGLLAVMIQVVIGVLLGAIAGYYSRYIGNIIMRVADIFLSFPTIIIVMTVVSVIGPNMWNIIAAIGLLRWPEIARLVRGEFLSLREQDFVQAAIAIAVPTWKILLKHMLLNSASPIIVAATYNMAKAVLLEAVLSFLGYGVQLPIPSWGNMLMDAQSLTILKTMPWLWLPPGITIFLTVLGLNLAGDGLVDALNPKLDGRS